MGGGGSTATAPAQEQIDPNLFNSASSNTLQDINAMNVGFPGVNGGAGAVFSGSYNPFANISMGPGGSATTGGYDPNYSPMGATTGITSSSVPGGTTTSGGLFAPTMGIDSASAMPAQPQPGQSITGYSSTGTPGGVQPIYGGAATGGAGAVSPTNNTFFNAGQGNSGLDIFNALAPMLGNLLQATNKELSPGGSIATSLSGQLPGLNAQEGVLASQEPILQNLQTFLSGQNNTLEGGQTTALGQIPGLMDNINQITQMAFDPQSALYNRLQGQNTQQTLATEAQQGVANSPYGAGITAQNNSDFNLNWNNNLLNRAVQGTGAINQDESSISGLLNNVMGLGSGITANANAITGAGNQIAGDAAGIGNLSGDVNTINNSLANLATSRNANIGGLDALISSLAQGIFTQPELGVSNNLGYLGAAAQNTGASAAATNSAANAQNASTNASLAPFTALGDVGKALGK